MSWPNDPTWSADQDGRVVDTEDGRRATKVVGCGPIYLPSGRLVACDPFAAMQAKGNPLVLVPPGRHPVTVTLADVSPELDGSHIREAYATVRFAEGADARRRALPLMPEGEPAPDLKEGEFIGFGVDAGTACFVDEWSIENCMPAGDTWYEGLFENERSDCWFARMDDPQEIRAGIANITLPLARDGENIVIVHSGWGDGTYPVVGSFDAADRLIAVHIDFGVIA